MNPEVSPSWRRHPLRTAFTATLGAALGYGLLLAVRRVEQLLILVLLSLFLAVGLDLPVAILVRRGLRRSRAVLLVLIGVVVVAAGLLAAVVPVVVRQVRALVSNLPHYASELEKRNGTLGHLETRLHLQQVVASFLHHHSKHSGGGTSVLHGLAGVGTVILSGIGGTIFVVLLTCWLLAGLPRLRRATYRLVPATRRTRVARLGEEISHRIGGYILGNLLTSLVAGVGTFVWLIAWHVPDPLALALLVAVFDLVPVVGSTVGGALVTLVALTVSLTTGVATLVFYIVYRFLEDYLLVPRVMRWTVSVSPLVTIIALLIGGSLFGILGALLAVPVAAAVQIVVADVAVPSLDRS